MRILLLIAVILGSLHGSAKNKPGTWLDYLSYSNAVKVADAGDKIFCATEGGLFYRDLSDNSINKFSRQEGLNDMGIQTMAWNESKKLLLIAYTNSNIDLLFANKVINIGDIKRKQSEGDKTINNILFWGNNAYLSCGFGIVVLNLDRREVAGTYIIGENGAQTAVFDMETDGETLYAASASGIFQAPVNHPNLLDYRSWKRISDIPNATGKFSNLIRFNGNLIAVFSRNQYNGDEAYILKNRTWQRTLTDIGYFGDMQANADFLTITTYEQVYVYNTSLTSVKYIDQYTLGNNTVKPIQPRSAATPKNGTVWIGDYTNGLISVTAQKNEQNLPPGPLNNRIFNLVSNNSDIWLSAGGRTDVWNNQYRAPVFQRLQNGEWKYFSNKEFPQMTGFYDIVQVAVDPSNPDHLFVASWGGGILEFDGNKLVKIFNNLNSPLQTAIPEEPLKPFTRIGGIAFDKNKTLWVTNAQSGNGLHSLSAAGEWKSFSLPEVAGQQYQVGQIIITKNNDKWIVVPRGRDVYVVNSDGSKKKYLPVTSYFNNGQQEFYNRMNDVYSIVEDLNEDIWIGTSNGVAVFSNARRIWTENNFYAYQPSLELSDGLYHPLLETEIVTAIAIDGANRKWLGTKNSGVYLVSERGDAVILHFTIENSPMLSNTISTIAVNRNSGEVFIGTDKGLISYQGDAPEGSDDFSNVFVYPNPVRETYQGPVVITGLMKDTDVRITDVAGNLVHKTKSLGGQVLWDGKNLNGNRVSTGVYLILCADASGQKTIINKLLFIN